jgi:hypothetical protein
MIRERDICIDISLLYTESLFYLFYLLIEFILCNDGTLIAGPGADSAAQGATTKVSLALFSGDFLDPSDGSHLSMDLAPVEGQRCVRVCIHLAGLARIVISVKDEAAIIDLLKKYDPGRWDTLCRGS